MSFLEVKNLVFSFDGKKNVLNDFSITLEQGSCTALLGRNGCGKSTFYDVLIGYHQPKSGEILLCGQKLADLTPHDIAKKIAYVPQSVMLNIDYSVFDFILFGRASHIHPWKQPSKADEDLAQANAERMGISNLLEKEINKISGGERQLACIARALTQESPLILLDEPTAALDFGNQAKLFRIIRELSKEGKTILFTTHNPNHIKIISCDVAVMSDGKILNHGKSEDALNEELLSEIYGERIQLTSLGLYSFSV